MFELQEPYRPRAIRFLELWEEHDWRLKVYSIAYRGESARAQLVAAAKSCARERLPQPATGRGRYGVGFLGVHEGRGANFIFVDWWADENELYHHVYSSTADRPEDLKYIMPSGPVVCVWDLRVLSFEREAWIDTVLANPAGPDLEAYLGRRLEEDV